MHLFTYWFKYIAQISNISPDINHHVHICIISNSLKYIYIYYKTNAQQDIHHESMSYSHTIKGLRAVLNLKSEGEI